MGDIPHWEVSEMSLKYGQTGYLLIGILIVVVIICILSMGGIQWSRGLVGEDARYDSDTVVGGVNLAALKGTLSALAMTQSQEYSMTHKYFPTIEKLIERSYSVGYHPKATDRVPLIPMFDLQMQITGSGFVIKAVPNTLSGAPKDSPTYVIDQNMQIREE